MSKTTSLKSIELAANSETVTNGDSEFTYTSLGQVRCDEVDDVPAEAAAAAVVTDASTQSSTPASVTDATALASPHTPKTTATAGGVGLEGLTFDEVIDELRGEARVANKDVCNYILNLLVGGEFDLDKNFIISNVTSILKMIQVIKCANPALKVGPVHIYDDDHALTGCM